MKRRKKRKVWVHWREARYKNPLAKPHDARKAQDPAYRRFRVPGNSYRAAYAELVDERGNNFADPSAIASEETGGRKNTITRHSVLGRMKEKKVRAFDLHVNGAEYARACDEEIAALQAQAKAEEWSEDDLYQETMKTLHKWGQLPDDRDP